MTFRMDDGISPRDLKIEAILEGLRGIRKMYLECVSRGKPAVCYAKAAGELISMFGSLMPNVWHDQELRFYILRGADGALLFYDAEADRYALVDIGKAVSSVLGHG
ncbi:hypothetical protein [Pyrobaculum neutrophilum]|uniref:Uncharacterized protein n=1 Tax=Pyrobaculum neutrophilum (strain DSM 2338 / JCM 9278 / NBRC 100436 / V24Sta) TaxID=444157 RepID=B1YBX4_PYRNV|nr:hypothetical protein [Pyrobaculum neutrophilum]ACB39358.1 conserved hypothetical protein [Pyrobaculum neutrophilum V24Sta]